MNACFSSVAHPLILVSKHYPVAPHTKGLLLFSHISFGINLAGISCGTVTHGIISKNKFIFRAVRAGTFHRQRAVEKPPSKENFMTRRQQEKNFPVVTATRDGAMFKRRYSRFAWVILKVEYRPQERRGVRAEVFFLLHSSCIWRASRMRDSDVDFIRPTWREHRNALD